ncbi:DUF4142 domain-containing protein [Mucilaginibacter arboris]|uniref:DUF4142 domain-containing protein n=1 Tax=Mucilaginibacter arboris TaxID=2682090 RepID=A0A7K1SXQ8_9SPHI|nr:DUF4142 domain-containing protein [Mucilaginibacter arboris]MVN22104.1 DUF4142 domain-containing protein [Mucilaginibacter arboris]
MKYKLHLFSAFLISIGFYACSGSGKNASADSTAQNASTKQPMDTADTRLANDLSLFCTNQVNEAQLATTKASTQKVKEFAKQAIELYNGLNKNLNHVSEDYAVKLPAAATPAITESLQKLSAVKGASFDHAYLLQTLKQHNAMIREYNAAKNIQCIPLKMFVGSNQAAIIKQAYAISALKDETP